MPRALVATGMELEYDTFGSPTDPALLLIAGLATQMTWWDETLCEQFAAWLDPELTMFTARFAHLAASRPATLPQR